MDSNDFDFDLVSLLDETEDELVPTIEDRRETGSMEKLDFDFSDLMLDDDSSDECSLDINAEDLAVFADEESYDKILDLENGEKSLTVEANYPYIKVSGLLIADEVKAFINTLTKVNEKLKGSFNKEEALDIVLNVKGEDYIVTQLPLTLDVMLSLFKIRRYPVTLVKSKSEEVEITGELMKGFIFV